MKIAFINTNREPYPLPSNIINGGLWITGKIIEDLSKNKEFDITFFTANDSVLSKTIKMESLGLPSFYKMIGNRDVTPSENAIAIFYEQLLIKEMIKQSNQRLFDCVHIHNNFFIISNFLSYISIPIVYTLHDPITPYHELFFKSNSLKLFYPIAISKYQRKIAEKMNIPIYETIYNGVDIENFEFNESGGDNLLFIGRIIKKKGVEEALKTSLLTNYPLNIVGSIREYDKDNIASFLSKINNKNIKIIKTASRTEAIKYYSTSKITLAPILWEEPFGLITVESMAAGTPVVGYARGALPEIIKDGETGFIVNPSDDDIRGNFIIKKTGIEGLCEAVERIYSMPEDQYRKMRKACREHVEKNFTVEKMVDAYEKVYEQILSIKK